MTVAAGAAHPCCGTCRFWVTVAGHPFGARLCTNRACGWYGHQKYSTDGNACGHFQLCDEEVPDAAE